MAVIIKESLRATLVCQNANQVNTVRDELTQYADRPRNGAVGDPDFVEWPAGMYGNGPTLVVLMEFRNRPDADDAWVSASKYFNFFQDGSMLMQYTSYSDPHAGVNDTVMHHIRHIPAWADDID